MKVMIFVKATADSEAGVMPTPELLTAMGEFNQSLVNAGILLAGEGLKPSRYGKRVHFSGKTRTVTDGPFTETKEAVGGYYLIEARDLDHALEIGKLCPARFGGVEVRPIMVFG
jgi:hypothetical protein